MSEKFEEIQVVDFVKKDKKPKAKPKVERSFMSIQRRSRWLKLNRP
jgi:hypothetical protein